ncbi:MAG: recombinase family protein, partial [Oscillospiraceae bacterium]
KGVSKHDIMQQLTDKGVTNNKGKPLSLTSFQHALKNRKYTGVTFYNGVEYSSTYPVLIDPAVFEKVQQRLAKVAHAPAAGKARQEYLLQGKAFCGMCGNRMVGDAGTSKTGAMYYYYSCGAKKKLHNCKKKSEKKDFIEWYVVEQTVEYVLTPARMEYIAERVVEEYNKEFNNANVQELERRIAKLERDADKAFRLIMESESQAVIKRYEKQIELLELQKTDLAIDLSKMRIANGIRYTKADILAWLKQFTKGDLMDEAFRRRIIDVFVNSIYLYDDKVV